ncbi:MAG: hypothetical protein IKV54_03560, partial [Clostridia bacterium]|nr:hypothetical protein [Clostridia bacterium]
MQNNDNSANPARREIKRVQSDALANKSELEKINITESEPVAEISIESAETGFKITDAPVAKEAPAEEALAEDAPAEEAPAEEAPVEEAPAEEPAPAAEDPEEEKLGKVYLGPLFKTGAVL